MVTLQLIIGMNTAAGRLKGHSGLAYSVAPTCDNRKPNSKLNNNINTDSLIPQINIWVYYVSNQSRCVTAMPLSSRYWTRVLLVISHTNHGVIVVQYFHKLMVSCSMCAWTQQLGRGRSRYDCYLICYPADRPEVGTKVGCMEIVVRVL